MLFVTYRIVVVCASVTDRLHREEREKNPEKFGRHVSDEEEGEERSVVNRFQSKIRSYTFVIIDYEFSVVDR